MHSFDEGSVLATTGDAHPLHSLTWTGASIIEACTVSADYGHLLALTADGMLHGIDFANQSCKPLCQIQMPSMPPKKEVSDYYRPAYRLHVSSDGRYAAIVVDRGREGVVVEVPGGNITMHLDGGDYLYNTVPFSACFLRHEGRDVIVHRTDWNRLDAADPGTGKSLTAREYSTTDDDKSGSGRFMDYYFHGGLLPSPGGSRLFDDGWHWHPISIPRAWSVTEWLASNPWESEDGASVVELMQREVWDMPVCWVSERHVALWRLESYDDDWQGAGDGVGVRILDVTTTERSADSRWHMDMEVDRVTNIFSDGTRLYVAEATATTVWDIASRTRIVTYPGFVSRMHDPVLGMLVSVAPDRISALQLPWKGVAY